MMNPLKKEKKGMNKASFIKTFSSLIAASCLFFSSSCGVKTYQNGYSFKQGQIAELKKGMDKQKVYELMGSPSTTSLYGSDEWFYMNTTKRAVGFMPAKIIKEDILKLTFKNDKLFDIKFVENKDTKALKFEKNQTPVRGNDISLIGDFFGNMGKFNKAKQQKPKDLD